MSRKFESRYGQGYAMELCIVIEEREKGRDLTHSYDKSPYTHRKTQKATWQHTNATKNFDYTTIADRLRTVSWGNDRSSMVDTGILLSHIRSPISNVSLQHSRK